MDERVIGEGVGGGKVERKRLEGPQRSYYPQRSDVEAGSKRPKRTKAERERDLVDIAALYLQGKRQYEIMEWLNANRPYRLTDVTICHDIKEIRERWLKAQLANFGEAQARELARLDELERAYWHGWQESLKEHEEVESEKSEGEDLDGVKRATRVKKSVRKSYGDHRFLEGIERCIQLRCKILGLYHQDQEVKDWRKAAEEAGISAEEAQRQFEAMVGMFLNAAKKKEGEETTTKKEGGGTPTTQ